MARKNAFTLIESIISLVVLAMIMFSLSFSTNILKQKTDDQYQLRIYRFANYLENPNHHYLVKKVQTNQIEIFNWKEKKVMFLKLQNNQLRLIGEDGGMIPLIGDVQSVNFIYEKGQLIVNLSHDDKNFQQSLLINQEQ